MKYIFLKFIGRMLLNPTDDGCFATTETQEILLTTIFTSLRVLNIKIGKHE